MSAAIVRPPAATRRRMASDTSIYAGAMLAERVLGFLLLPVLTRHLSPTEYGVWTQTFVVSSMLMPLTVFCLPAAMVRYFAPGLGFDQRRRWTLHAIGWIGLALCLVAAAALGRADNVADWVYGEADARGFVPVLCILVAADALGDMATGFLRAAFRTRWVAGLVLARGLVRFSVMLIALAGLGWTFRSAFLLATCVQAALVAGIMLAALAAPAHDEAGVDAGQSVDWQTMVAFSAPLVLISALTSVNAFTDRFVLTHLLGLDSVAVYAAVSSLVSLASVAYTVLGFTLFPVLSRHWAQGDVAGAAALSEQAVRVFLFLALPFVLCLSAVIGTLLPLLATAHYRVGPQVALMIGLGVIGYGLYQIMLYRMLLAGRGLRAAWLVVGAALVNAVLNVVFVPDFGLSAAAAAALVSNGLLAAGAYRSADMTFPWRGGARNAAIGAVAALAAWLATVTVPGGGWPSLGLGVALASAIVVGSDLRSRASMIRALSSALRGGA